MANGTPLHNIFQTQYDNDVCMIYIVVYLSVHMYVWSIQWSIYQFIDISIHSFIYIIPFNYRKIFYIFFFSEKQTSQRDRLRETTSCRTNHWSLATDTVQVQSLTPSRFLNKSDSFSGQGPPPGSFALPRNLCLSICIIFPEEKRVFHRGIRSVSELRTNASNALERFVPWCSESKDSRRHKNQDYTLR